MKSMELEMYGDPFLLETQQELKKDHVTLSWFPVVPIAFPPEKKQEIPDGTILYQPGKSLNFRFRKGLDRKCLQNKGCFQLFLDGF